MNELALKIENVKKEYRLGAIGGGTLKGDLQSFMARRKGLEDPNSKIGSDAAYHKNERFLALDGVSFDVKKGEAVGIIGHNGAGKSTLLKLLSRVTAPTEGRICINGRIVSMLEVGTGFHPELTGRENVYMNGAILGMTKAEIDSKFDQIVEFAEMEKFIDTPVKRYSSGMYVKLAFSVAAHLDSEIMIMDEVLAVGDMAFQKKCLNKMRDAAKKEGRTVLYVSHNMSTIRQLCDRCVVLNQGKLIFNGEVEGAIRIYLGKNIQKSTFNDIAKTARESIGDEMMHMESVELLGMCEPILTENDLEIELKYLSSIKSASTAFRAIIFTGSHIPVGMAASEAEIESEIGKNTIYLRIKLPNLAEGEYSARIVLYEVDENGNEAIHDVVEEAFYFRKIIQIKENNTAKRWNERVWGNIVFPTIVIRK